MTMFGSLGRRSAGRGLESSVAAATDKDLTGDWSRAGSAVLDVNGNGLIVFDSDNAWQTVTVEYVVVSTDQAAGTSIPTVRVYKGEPAAANFEGGTIDGNLDTGVGRIVMGPADEIQVKFTGGVPGSRATARLSGTFVTRR